MHGEQGALERLRIGHGFDVHAVKPGAALRLGGIDIESPFALLGHSDADVLLHAVTDALLGAAAAGDIGTWFPDSDDAWKGADSAQLLRRVWHRLRDDGWRLINVDAVVLAQRPKLAPHIRAMRSRIAGILDTDEDRVGLKATTTERLGFVGREEGLAASASALLLSPPR